MAYTLLIGNKNYSSWSMRPWVLMKQAGIPFAERMVRFDSFAPHSSFKQSLSGISPTGKVPVLLDDAHTHADGSPLAVWDTLSIAEYLADQHPDRALWPTAPAARALARSVCAEMHSGFGALRTHFPMNIEASLPHIGQLVLRDQPSVVADLERLKALWSGLLATSGGPLLFGQFSIADAYFAPMVMRLRTYQVPLPSHLAAYVQAVTHLPGVQSWIHEALHEADFLDFEEPYRLGR
jgi:glutathione S-transferase